LLKRAGELAVLRQRELELLDGAAIALLFGSRIWPEVEHARR